MKNYPIIDQYCMYDVLNDYIRTPNQQFTPNGVYAVGMYFDPKTNTSRLMKTKPIISIESNVIKVEGGAKLKLGSKSTAYQEIFDEFQKENPRVITDWEVSGNHTNGYTMDGYLTTGKKINGKISDQIGNYVEIAKNWYLVIWTNRFIRCVEQGTGILLDIPSEDRFTYAHCPSAGVKFVK